MADDLDQVAVRVGHLRNLERVLETASSLVTAEDLARQFRAMSGREQKSHLARALDEQLTRVRGWIRDADQPEDDDGSAD